MDESPERSHGDQRDQHHGRPWWLRLLPPVVVLAALIDFVLQNTRTVRIHFLVWHANTGLGWALLVAGILGVVAGLLLPRLRRFV